MLEFISSKNHYKKILSKLLDKIFAVKLLEFMNENQDFMLDN